MFLQRRIVSPDSNRSTIMFVSSIIRGRKRRMINDASKTDINKKPSSVKRGLKTDVSRPDPTYAILFFRRKLRGIIPLEIK